MSEKPKTLHELLAAPFKASEVKSRAVMVSKTGKALVAFYIDARNVMDRLDQVFGPGRWSDEYQIALDKNIVICTLSCCVYDQATEESHWVKKSDVGVLNMASASKGNDDAIDRSFKGVFSDALKRAAVKWGIGRYLYDIKSIWHPYDAEKKQFKTPPKLPAQFLPSGDDGTTTPDDEPDAPSEQGHQQDGPDAKASNSLREKIVGSFQNCKTLADYKGVNTKLTDAIRDSLTPEDTALVIAARKKAYAIVLENEEAAKSAPI